MTTLKHSKNVHFNKLKKKKHHSFSTGEQHKITMPAHTSIGSANTHKLNFG